MIRSRQASPSICGMWMSSVTTSGSKAPMQVERLEAVARELDLEARLACEDLAQQLAHQRGIVDDEDLDHERAFVRLCVWKRVEQAALGAGQQFRRIEQQHDAPRSRRD